MHKHTHTQVFLLIWTLGSVVTSSARGKYETSAAAFPAPVGNGGMSEVGGWNNVLPLTPRALPGRLGEGLAPGTGRTGSIPYQSPERAGQRERAHFPRTSLLATPCPSYLCWDTDFN